MYPLRLWLTSEDKGILSHNTLPFPVSMPLAGDLALPPSHCESVIRFGQQNEAELTEHQQEV